MRPPPALIREPQFLRFWGGQSVSLLGSQFTLLALPIAAAVTLHATPAEMGVVAALQFAPGLLVGFAGVWLDRVRRRPVLVATQLASAVVLATVPVAAVLHVLTFQQLAVVAFLAGSAAAVFGVAQVAFLPSLVRRAQLVEANARIQVSRTVAALIGPGVAGAAVQALTAPIAIAVDAASFLVGAATAAWVRVDEPVPDAAPGRGVAREVAAGLVLPWRQPLVRAIAATLLIANAGGAMTTAVLVLLFVGSEGITPAELGLTFVASSLSSLAGSFLIRPLQRRAGLGPVMVLATVLVGAGALIRVAAGFSPRPAIFPLLIAAGLVNGFGLMTYNVPQAAIQQAVVPGRMLGRTAAGVSLAVSAGAVTGALTGGLLGEVAGLRWTLVAATALTVLCALPTAFGPLRSLRDVPGAAAADLAAG